MEFSLWALQYYSNNLQLKCSSNAAYDSTNVVLAKDDKSPCTSSVLLPMADGTWHMAPPLLPIRRSFTSLPTRRNSDWPSYVISCERAKEHRFVTTTTLDMAESLTRPLNKSFQASSILHFILSLSKNGTKIQAKSTTIKAV